jgi:hypothetical protein
MSLKLNKIRDDVIQEDIIRNRERLQKFLTADAASPMRSDPVRYHNRLGDCSMELGLELYQQEDSVEEIREHLARAGEHLLKGIVLPPKEASNPSLSPLTFEEGVALAVCFCQRAAYEAIDKIPEQHFFNIKDEKARAFFAMLGQYMNVLRQFVVSSKLDQESWQKTEAECLRPKASRFDAKVNLAKLRALRAVATGDAALLNEAVGVLVGEHENEAKRGDFQKSSQGFICLSGLMFAKLGMNASLSCTVNSLYLPLHLLKH